ncbi:hypothetical protein G4H71_04660 [Rhodococcus triatomae]|uniref:hypothetical protein n=1 Tax=Rhodococcus triatomae TaxID=300028 RepID=UPI0011136BF8|nr:hypothetical protein [Rhodococcus triatomae]QNG17915.1 hypothetical protein G4H72_03385 [Rhodococcus triatomae]QNG22417.1 hypothetical protein G4H71_04660 [Rhodococcus triatomae]
MSSERSLLARAADRVNVVAVALRSAPLVGSLIRRNVTVDLDDTPRSGHAVAHRGDRGTTVKVWLDRP